MKHIPVIESWKKTQNGPYSPGLLQGAMTLTPQLFRTGLLCRQALLHLLGGLSGTGAGGHRLRREYQTPQCLKLAPHKGGQMKSVPSPRPPPVLKHSCTDSREGREASLDVTSVFSSSTYLPHFLALKLTYSEMHRLRVHFICQFSKCIPLCNSRP